MRAPTGLHGASITRPYQGQAYLVGRDIVEGVSRFKAFAFLSFWSKSTAYFWQFLKATLCGKNIKCILFQHYACPSHSNRFLPEIVQNHLCSKNLLFE